MSTWAMRCSAIIIYNCSVEDDNVAFARYTLAGGIATAVHYAVLLALVEVLHLPPAPAAAIGALCGAAVAYVGNRRFTFTDTTAAHSRALPRFLLVAVVGAALNGLIVWVGNNVLGWHYLFAQALATLLVLFLTYRLNRHWTFA